MHGSEGVWRKFLNASSMLKVNMAICGGDLTGKMIVPVVEQAGKFAYYFMGKNHVVEKPELDATFKTIRGIGYYPYQTNEKEYEEMTQDPKKVDAVFQGLGFTQPQLTISCVSSI